MSDCDGLECEARRLADNIISLLKEKGIPRRNMYEEVVSLVSGNESEFLNEEECDDIDIFVLGGTLLEHLIGGSGFDEFIKKNNK